MAPPPKQGMILTPDKLGKLGKAFDLAICKAEATGTPYTSGPTPELRRQIAGLILAEANLELDQPAQLAARALDRLQLLRGDSELIARRGSKHRPRRSARTTRSPTAAGNETALAAPGSGP